MQLTIQREALLKPLQLIIGVVERRQVQPILANVLLLIKEQQLFLVANDLEVELASSMALSAPPENDAPITVAGRKLMDICRTLPANSMLELKSTNKALTIRTVNSHFNLATLPAEDFPRTKEQPEKAKFTLPQSKLLSLVRRTYFAIAENNPHHYLNGLLMQIKDGEIRAVASDAHRISLYKISGTVEENIFAQVIVPKKAVLELMRLLEDSDDLVTITIAENYIRVQGANFSLTSKLIDSKYPNYNKFIPAGGDKKIILNRDVFKDALVRVGILSNEVLRSMRLELSNNLLRMVAHNTDQEKAEETIPIEYNGASLDIGFNIAYLLDVLASVQTETITVTFKDSASGIVIQENEGQEDCLYVVMPFQL